MKNATIWLAAALLATSATAQTKKSPAKPTVTQEQATQPAAAAVAPPPPPPPFEPVTWAADKPATAYVSNEIAKVYAWLEGKIAAVPGKPDKFSTPDEVATYGKAVSAAVGSIGSLAVVAPCSKEYKPELQEFEIKVGLPPIKDYSLRSPDPEVEKLRKIVVGTRVTEKSTYTGQNAYGASTEVFKEVRDEFVLSFADGSATSPADAIRPVGGLSSSYYASRLPYHETLNILTMSVKMPSAEARAADGAMACLYVVSPVAPFAFKYRERTLPNRNSPFDRTANGFAILGKLDRVAVINTNTGQVYKEVVRWGL